MRRGPDIPELNVKVRSEAIGQMPVANQGAAWRSVANSFANMGSLLGDMAHKAAAREGEAEGAIAGMDPEFRLKDDGTTRGAAFNRAAIRTAKTQTETRLITGLDELSRQHPNDVKAFTAGADALKAEFIDKLDPRLQPDLVQQFERLKLPYGRDYARTEARQMADRALAEALPAIDAREKNLGRLAYSGGLDEVADGAIGGEMASLVVTLAEYGPKTEFSIGDQVFEADPERGGVLSASEIQERVLSAGEAVALNRVKGAFDRLETPEARAEFSEDFRKDFEKGERVTAAMDLKTVEQLDRYFGTAIREDAAAARAAIAEQNAVARERASIVRSRVSDFKSFASNGLVPDQAELSGLRREAEALGKGDIVADIDRIARTSTIVREVSVKPPSETEAQIRALRAGGVDGLSPEAADTITALETGLRQVREGLARDPVGFAVSAGIVPEIDMPIDGELAANGIMARNNRAQLIEGRYGVPAGLFNKAEAVTL